MKDTTRGQPITRIELVSASLTVTADGRPVVPAQEYIYGTPPADARPIMAVSDDVDEGMPVVPIGLVTDGSLKTSDGRPVMAVMGFDAAGAASPLGSWQNVYTSTYDIDSNAWTGLTLRIRIPAANLTDLTGSQLRFTIAAGTTEAVTISAATIGVEGGTNFSFASTPVTVRFGGATSVVIPANNSTTSDGAVLSYTGTSTIVIALYFNGGTSSDMVRRASGVNANGATGQYKAGDDTATLSPTGYTSWDAGANRSVFSAIQAFG